MKRFMMLLAALALVLTGGCAKEDRESLVLAKVEDNTITIKDFETTANTLDNKYLPETDDMEGKKELLQHMINKEIMALKAEAMGYEKEEAFKNFWDQFKGPFMITALWNEEIKKKVSITEEDIEKYWQEMHYEYSISQIIVASEEEALEIREKALAGEDFAELAKRYSLGAGAENGGYVGAAPVGNIHWWVEEMLFVMKEGDISTPVTTDAGWAIIKVHKKRKIIPDLDREYAKRRVQGIMEYKARNDLKALIEKQIGLKIYADAVNIAYDALPEDTPYEDIVSYKVTRESAPEYVIPDQYREMIVCEYDDGMYSLADLEELYKRFSLVERPRRQFGRESITQLLKKVVYDKVLPVYAENVAKVLDNPEVAKNLDNRREQFLVYRLYQDQIEDEVTVTTKEVQDYYNSNKEFLRTQEKRNYAIILLDDYDLAKSVSNQAKGGSDFTMLVRKYSKDPTARENEGKTGLVANGNYLDYDGVAFTMEKEGDVSDAFQVSRGWAVVKLLQIEPGRIPTLEEASQSVRKEITEKKGEELLKKKLESWKEGYKIEINEKNLKKAVLGRTKI